MNDEQPASTEVVIKEYPNSTRWLEGGQVIGAGNLILTSERLVFLHQIPISGEEVERFRKLSGKITTKEMIDLALSFHKKNFQVSLSTVTSVKTGIYSLLPLPRPCLRVFYKSSKKDMTTKRLAFMFTIPLWKGWFQLEITTVMTWVKAINRALEYKQLKVS